MKTSLLSNPADNPTLGLKPHEIRAELVRNQVKIYVLADKLGVKTAAVHQVIVGDRPNPRIRAGIAVAIGMEVCDIWPGSKPQETVFSLK